MTAYSDRSTRPVVYEIASHENAIEVKKEQVDAPLHPPTGRRNVSGSVGPGSIPHTIVRAEYSKILDSRISGDPVSRLESNESSAAGPRRVEVPARAIGVPPYVEHSSTSLKADVKNDLGTAMNARGGYSVHRRRLSNAVSWPHK